MTAIRTFPPADQCEPEDLDAIADLVVSDPRASYDLAGSRDHIEALCRQYQTIAQNLDSWTRYCGEAQVAQAAAERDNRALQQALTAETNRRDALVVELAQARQAISEREDEIAAVNNSRQAEVNEAAASRERADEAEAVAEIFETTARAVLHRRAPGVTLAEIVHAVDGRIARALVRERQVSQRLAKQLEDAALLLDRQRATREANDRIRSAFATAVPAICDGVTVENLNHQLDAELAAHPDAGPLHHARDQRDHQEDTTP